MGRSRLRALSSGGSGSRTVRSSSGLSATKSQRQKSARVNDAFGDAVKIVKITTARRHVEAEPQDMQMPALRARKLGNGR